MISKKNGKLYNYTMRQNVVPVPSKGTKQPYKTPGRPGELPSLSGPVNQNEIATPPSNSDPTDYEKIPYAYTQIYTCMYIDWYVFICIDIFSQKLTNTCWLGNSFLSLKFAFMVDFETSYARGDNPVSAAPHPVSPRAWNEVKRCLVRMLPQM